jgi:ABC-type lipoprotein release transport system permease subunit
MRPWLDANLFPSGVSASTAMIFAALGVALAAAVSSVVPAARASRVDPINAISGH